VSATADAGRLLRIGELAELTGTTPRTIRYYEEIGLLHASAGREQGKHRLYTEAEGERVREILRLRDLLGLSLEQLSRLLEAESARAEIRREYQATEDPSAQRRLLEEALGHLGNQLELLRARRAEIEQLEGELEERRRRVLGRLGELARG
jgi:MerR family transcriptional regulator, repressor of the yfmOP operon